MKPTTNQKAPRCYSLYVDDASPPAGWPVYNNNNNLMLCLSLGIGPGGGQTFLPEGHMGHPVGLQRAALKKLNLLDNKWKSNLLLHET